ncbi:hypothetical protein FACS1894202_08690 [Clostridia bacterium]|nr:hypothetical protein FACS1894202_08650 [Clostridia bacterium]GHU89836.1 hypothetical protein FACS1894202_08690 [Clostridia bacterium]
MKKKLSLVIALMLAFSLFAIPAFAAVPDDAQLVDDFNRATTDNPGTNSQGRDTWWYNFDNSTITDNALVISSPAGHFGVGANVSGGDYLVLSLKGDAAGVLINLGANNPVYLADAKGKDGAALPALTDSYQDFVIDLAASGIKFDQGFHLNIESGTLYADYIYYLSAATAPDVTEPTPAPEFPAKALVDDFNRPADELDNSGGTNSQGLDTWWYNAESNTIADNALSFTDVHFGIGANIPSEAAYKYLVIKIKGVKDGKYDDLLLNLGASNPVLFKDMKGADGKALPAITTSYQELVIDLAASGVKFDQGFHINKGENDSALFIDEIYYTSTAPAAPGKNPNTGDGSVALFALIALLLAGTGVVVLRKAKN